MLKAIFLTCVAGLATWGGLAALDGPARVSTIVPLVAVAILVGWVLGRRRQRFAKPENTAGPSADGTDRYRALFEDARDGLYCVTREGRLLDINRAGLEMLGSQGQDLVGLTTDRFYADPAQRLRFQQEIESKGSVKDFEVTLKRRDGSRIDCLLTSSVLRDDSGGVVGYHGIMHDVTERKRAEAALAESERRFRATFEQAAVGIAHVTYDGEVLAANRRFCGMLGLGDDSACGFSLGSLSWSDESQEESQLLEDLLSGSLETFTLEKELNRVDGSSIWVNQTVSALRGEAGAVEYLIYVLADLSAHKRLEDQYRHAQKMEALGRLAGGIAHDFNNLLTGLIGYSELALHEAPPPSPAATYLGEVIELGRRARDLTAQLLAFSRPTDSRRVPVDVNKLIEADVRMLERTLGEHIQLVFDPGSRLPPVHVDPGQLEQALLNLAINARDAMGQGGRLTIRTFQLSKNADSVPGRRRDGTTKAVCIEVADTGHGMDEGTMERIFEPFFTTKAPGVGTGLGLAMVHGIMNRHGGQVEVRSEPGSGSVFTLSLPPFDGEGPGPRKDEHGPAMQGGDETILLVEDEKAVRILVERLLTRMGYRVLSAADADEAIALYREQGSSVHLLLSDIVMPGINGVELSRILRGMNPDLKVVFISGFMNLEDLADQVGRSGDPLVQKPFRPADLLAQIRETLDSR